MAIVRRIVGLYLILVAVAVAVNFLATPLYHPGGDEPFAVWEILDWFMAVALVFTILTAYHIKRFVDGDESADLKQYIRSNTLFYVTVIVFLTFFHNWFSLLANPDGPDGQLWIFIDTVLPIVVGIAGCRLWNTA